MVLDDSEELCVSLCVNSKDRSTFREVEVFVCVPESRLVGVICQITVCFFSLIDVVAIFAYVGEISLS